MKSPILIYLDPNKLHTFFIDVSKYAWYTVLVQEYNTNIGGKEDSHQCPSAYTNWLFQGSQLNWPKMTKEANAIYMLVKISVSIWQMHSLLFEVIINF